MKIKPHTMCEEKNEPIGDGGREKEVDAFAYLNIFGANIDAADEVAHLSHSPRVNFIALSVTTSLTSCVRWHTSGGGGGDDGVRRSGRSSDGRCLCSISCCHLRWLQLCGRWRTQTAHWTRRLHFQTFCDWRRCAQIQW